MSDASDKNDFKGRLQDLLNAFDARQRPDAVDQYAGVMDAEPLEHTTRVLLLDSILRALGWELSGERDITEEARVQGGTTLFIDYLGVNPESRVPLMIVEAKAWNKPFVRGRDGRFRGGPNELISKAIQHIRSGGDSAGSPVTLDWHDWLTQVRDYIKGLLALDHHVKRVVITSGQWMVIFIAPVSTFCRDNPVAESDWMILEKADFVAQSDDIFDLIARKRLVTDVPRHVRLTQLSAYISVGDLVDVFHSLLVKYECSGHSWVGFFPRIQVYPAITLLRCDGKVVTASHGSPFTIPESAEEAALLPHLEEVEMAAHGLLDAVSAELGVPLTASSITEFPGFPTQPRHVVAFRGEINGSQDIIYFDLDRQVPDQGVMATGNKSHFLLPQATLRCQFHDWASCQAVGAAASPTAITCRTTNPRSFFISGEEHHCAHQGMHDRRERRCKTDPIDRYLCCKACALQAVCWPPGEPTSLPCGT